jgi:hypothetical protein
VIDIIKPEMALTPLAVFRMGGDLNPRPFQWRVKFTTHTIQALKQKFLYAFNTKSFTTEYWLQTWLKLQTLK